MDEQSITPFRRASIGSGAMRLRGWPLADDHPLPHCPLAGKLL